MKQAKQDFALGLTAIVILVVCVGTIVFIYPIFHAPRQTLVIHFHHEEGMAPLKPGSGVILGGSVTVGTVRSIGVAEVEDRSTSARLKRTVFVVTAEIDRDVKLYGNCEITTDQPAIGGSGYVTIINVGTPGVPLVQPVQGRPPQSLAAAVGLLSRRLLGDGGLVDNLTKMADPKVEDSLAHKVLASLDDLNAITRELRVQLTPEQQRTLLNKFHLILDDLNATTAELRHQMVAGDETVALGKIHIALDRLSDGLTDASAMLKENRPVVRETLDTLAHAARTVDTELLTSLRNELDASNPGSLTGKLHVAMDTVNGSLREVQTITAESERMVVLSRPTLEKILTNFQAMSEQLRLASQEVLLNPSKLIWGPGQQREEQLLVFQAARNFAEAAGQLDDAAGRLEAIIKTLPTDGRLSAAENQELQAIQDAVRGAFQRFERAEQVLWDQLK